LNTLTNANVLARCMLSLDAGARHLQRSDHVLQALNVSACATRCSTIPQVLPSESDVDRFKSFRTKASTSQAAAAKCDSASIGVDTESILSPAAKWGTTSIHDYSTKNCCLLQALLATEEEHWGRLWMSELYRRHMIVQSLQEIGLRPGVGVGVWGGGDGDGGCRSFEKLRRLTIGACPLAVATRCHACAMHASRKPQLSCAARMYDNCVVLPSCFVILRVCACVFAKRLAYAIRFVPTRRR
jgi:hypothetical protein